MPIIGLSTILISWGVGVLLYYSVGQPGWYGEQLFVILEDQEVVSQAVDIENYQERREFVYHTLVQHANTTQSELRTVFDQLGLQYQPYYLVNSIRVEGGPLVRLWLMMRPEVDRVLDNPRLRPLPEELPQQYGSESLPSNLEWNLAQIQADRVWQEFKITGEGIVVGQSDSGVQWDHPELYNSYRGRYGDHDYNWLDPWYHTLEPVDKNGHGTHTLGTILGRHTGIAPGATWYACANLARNLGNPAFYLDCLQFMLAPYPLYGNPFNGDSARGAHVINNSWGCPGLEGCDEDTFLFAVRNLIAAGVFVVASAGNDGPACGSLQYPPANYAELFTVGAIDNMGELAIFSSIGPTKVDNLHLIKPDIVAPGMDVLSSTPGDTYAKYSGTSMAGPHVVGVVALMWAANPELIGDIQATKQALIESAIPYSGSLPDCPGVAEYPSTAVGYGILNAYQAVKLALQMK
jgi:subtilisin family serine protease